MNFGVLQFLTLIGSVGLFLYGMKLMSEGLQKAAGDRLRGILALIFGCINRYFRYRPHPKFFCNHGNDS